MPHDFMDDEEDILDAEPQDLSPDNPEILLAIRAISAIPEYGKVMRLINDHRRQWYKLGPVCEALEISRNTIRDKVLAGEFGYYEDHGSMGIRVRRTGLIQYVYNQIQARHDLSAG